jgi:hypothetical protein
MLIGQAVQGVVIQAYPLAPGILLAGQVSHGIISITPIPHVRVAHRQLAPAQVVSQGGGRIRRPPADLIHLRQCAQLIIGITRPHACRGDDGLHLDRGFGQRFLGVSIQGGTLELRNF